MKTRFFTVIAFSLAAACDGGAGTFILDSFSNGPFNLGSEGQLFNSDQVPGVLNRTGMRGYAAGPWTSVSTAGSDVMTFIVDLRTPPTEGAGRATFDLYYGTGDPVRLLATDALVLRVTGLTGQGEVTAAFGDIFGSRVTISGTGDLIYPFSNFFGTRDGEFDLSMLTIRLQAKSADFSVTLDEISVVPEASSVLLLGLGGAWLAGRRRRGTAGRV